MNYFSSIFARAVADELIDRGQLKVASQQDLEKVAAIADHVGSCLTMDTSRPDQLPADVGYEVGDAILKLADDSLHTGDKAEQENSPENADAQVGGISAMDQEERPQGTYLEGVGKTKLDTAKGHVGKQEQPAKSPKDEEKPNSATSDREKSATVQAILAKLSGDTGSLITGDKAEQSNTPQNADAQVGGVAAMDEEERPQGSYLTGVGKTNLDTRKGHVGKEEVPAKSPKDEEKANSPIEERAKSAGVTPAYLAHFEETAGAVLPKIAADLSEEDKVAVVKSCMGISPGEREVYIERFNKEASAQQSSTETLERIAALLRK